jgi:formate hydrogenlyase subunit 3/multisubunit Na+/H+ antiporter MnhD subunit
MGLPASGGMATAIFVLALAGFGIKAGLMPLHSWLPGAHAGAPSHVSALLSGVLLKLGIYGLLRVTSLFADPPPAWGAAVAGLGLLSSLLGVAFALGQHDLKRLLAYHSIENLGIIALGLGVALLGRSAGEPAWVALGLGGCLLHVWNHALFKPLLFLGAGAVVHRTGTREIDATGGLARSMPATAALFSLGSIAICGLPPLNGFASELLVYLGLVRTALAPGRLHWATGLVGVAVLAMVGGLALACFVKVFGVVFLGEPRSEACRGAHDPPPTMIVPMALLAAGCLAVGVAPWLAVPALAAATEVWAPGTATAGAPLVELAPLRTLTWAALALAGLAAVAALPLVRVARGRRDRRRPPTWGCGYAGASPRLQYTGASFAQTLVGLFRWALRPRIERPPLPGVFPAPAPFEVEVGDPVLDRLVGASARLERLSLRLRFLQHGTVQRQILYLVGALAALLLLSLAARD